MSISNRSSSKTLKICPPDLEIIVGSGEDQTTFYYHSQVMAHHSDYIDTVLSLSKPEQDTEEKCYKIGLPDITAELWQSMISYLKPSMVGRLDHGRAKELARWYDKYQFTEGIAICDHIISTQLLNQDDKNDDSVTLSSSLSQSVDIVVMAQKYRLEQTLEVGKRRIQNAIQSRNMRACFREQDMNRLKTVFAQSDLLWDELKLRVGSALDIFDRSQISSSSESKMFGHIIVSQLQIAELQLSVLDAIHQVQVVGAGTSFCNGIYVRDDTEGRPFDDMPLSFTMTTQINENQQCKLRLYGTNDCVWYISALESDNPDISNSSIMLIDAQEEEKKQDMINEPHAMGTHFYKAIPVYSGPFYYWHPPRVDWQVYARSNEDDDASQPQGVLPAPTLYYSTFQGSCLL